ncbi:glycosyltransferase [Altererythrobacter aerius]|uniref:Glycosyltransferase n=1 Tax=Tsuneonella aeria TaxID=1837929 RepID=A0A6I4TAA3_9SPHN|nr:glycosyltransferase [Tsuneonella aeria]MXO74449.1 glycosyltransferase [Tsuneonella aeria]
MRRVLSISTLYPNPAAPRFGAFVARSMEALAALGDWHVTVVNPIGLPPMALGRYRALKAATVDAVERKVEVYRPPFRLIPTFGARNNPARIARAILPLVRRLHGEAPFDLVDAQFFYPDGPAAAEVAKALGLPLSIKARGSDIHYWGGKPWALAQMLAAAEQATGLLAVSQALARDMSDLGFPGHRITVHRTGLDRDRFRPLHHPQLRRRLGRELGIELPASAPVLVSVGALIPIKGQDLVIDALEGLPPDTVLLLVGHGPEESRLRTQARARGAADRVHFLGNVDHDLLPLILSAADAMVLPSAREGLANAWVEALACGTPLVICDTGGAREVVVSHEAGRIVARYPHAIAAGVRELLADPPRPEAVAALADGFSWQANAAALAAHYTRLAG